MGNVLQPGYFDTNAHSWASYGAVRGIQRLLRIAAKHGIKTSVMTNGVLSERTPEIVRQIKDGGHEIVAHSYGMDVVPAYLDETADRENIRRDTNLYTSACGARPIGWISPRGTGSHHSPRLLAEEGNIWHGSTPSVSALSAERPARGSCTLRRRPPSGARSFGASV